MILVCSEGFIAGVTSGTRYKYHIESAVAGYVVDKADPYDFAQKIHRNGFCRMRLTV